MTTAKQNERFGGGFYEQRVHAAKSFKRVGKETAKRFRRFNSKAFAVERPMPEPDINVLLSMGFRFSAQLCFGRLDYFGDEQPINVAQKTLWSIFKTYPKRPWTKMRGMPISRLQALQSCDGKSLDAAVRTLIEISEEDYDHCLAAIDDLLLNDLVKLSSGRKETTVALTDAGREQEYFERTRVTRKTAHSILDEMEQGD